MRLPDCVPDPPEPRDPPLRREPEADEVEEVLKWLIEQLRWAGTRSQVRLQRPGLSDALAHIREAATEVETWMAEHLTEDWPA